MSRGELMALCVRGLAILACVSGALTPGPAFAGDDPADSLSYAHYRDRVRHSDSASAFGSYIDAADALASDGLYDEALAVLRELVPPERLSSTSSATPSPTAPHWRLSAGVDVYRLEDIDTAAMTQDEREQYRRLMETPLSVWVRSTARFLTAKGPVHELTPSLYVSERKARFETDAVSNPRDWFRLFAGARTEKWYSHDPGVPDAELPASGSAPRSPFDAHSSDMGGLTLRATPATPSAGEERIRWSLPVSLDWEHYRRNRAGYESRVEYRFSPTLEAAGKKTPFSGLVAGEIRYEDRYGSEEIDSLDALRLSMRTEASAAHGPTRMRLGVGWYGDDYVGGRDLARVDRYESVFSATAYSDSRVSPRIDGRIVAERESYTPLGEWNGRLDGQDLLFRISSRVSVLEWLSVTPEAGIERRWAPLRDTVGTDTTGRLYLWEARQAWEPGVRVLVSVPLLDASLRIAGRTEDIDGAFERFVTDNRSLRLGADLSLRLHERLAIGSFLDYQYRSYAPYGAGRVSENISASLNVSLRL